MPTESRPTDLVLEITDLKKTYRSRTKTKEVLKGLSFGLPAGQVVALLGANGAGKTTLVNIASTLIPPSSGSVRVCGYDVVREAREVRRRISLTGQFAAVDAELTGRENLVFFSRLHGMSMAAAKARADELLESFRLSEAAKQRVGEYSGGMRRRLDIAASLVVQPTLLFLDEPTTGLDPLSRRELWAMVKGLRDSGVAILLTTQYLDEAERLADNIVLIRDGQMVLEGPPAKIRQQSGASVCVISLDDPADLEQARNCLRKATLGGGTEQMISVEGLTLSFTAAGGVNDLSVALRALEEAGISVGSAALNAPSLDDVFLRLAFKPGVIDEARPDGRLI